MSDDSQNVSLMELIHPTPKQIEFLQAVKKYKYILGGGAKGFGKALGLDVFIPTPTGWKLNGELQVGDFVIHISGLPVRVIGVTEIFYERAYRVKFSDGTDIVAGEGHLWKTMTAIERRGSERRTEEYRSRRRNVRPARGKGIYPELVLRNKKMAHIYLDPQNGSLRTTDEIVNTLKAPGTTNHSITQHEALRFDKIDLSIVPPYTLGAWLGDGTSVSGQITGIDKEIFCEIEKDGFIISHHTKAVSHGVRGLANRLKEIGVLGYKHIPRQYLRASYEQRLALLQGIMDTDGYVDAQGSCSITQKNKCLFDDIVELIRTFGIVVNTSYIKKVCTNSPTKKAGMYWNAQFIPAIPIFRLERKLKRLKEKVHVRNSRRFIVGMEDLGIQPVRCIQIAHPDGMYLAGESFIPTHNSYILRWTLVLLLVDWAQRGHKNVRVLLGCEDYPSLKDRQIVKIKQEFPSWLGKLSENQIEGMSFQLREEYGGGIIALRNLDDVSKYASSEFAAVAVDELTKNPKTVFDQFRSIIRWPGISDTKFIAGTNPGGVGASWVKKLWITKEYEPDEQEADQFCFIPGKSYDNPYLAKEYILSLRSLPAELRSAYLDGSWDVFEGQFFSLDEEEHIVDPFPIPSHWLRIRGIDHGRTSPTSCHWYALDEEYNLWIYREHYVRGFDADINAGAIVQKSQEDEMRYWFTVMDAACWAKSGAETISDIYAKNGVIAEPSSKHKREHGWALLHEYLRTRTPESVFRRDRGLSSDALLPTWVTVENGIVIHPPKLRIFKNCPEALRELKNAVRDEKNPEDIDPRSDDHFLDECRYVLEMLSEGHTRPPKNWLEKILDKSKKASTVSPQNLGKFYSNKL